MSAVNDTLRKFAAHGLLPLSFVASIIAGDHIAYAYESPQEVIIEQQSANTTDTGKTDNTPSKNVVLGAKLFTPTTFENTTGMWVGRNIDTIIQGNSRTPQLHEYFATDDNKLYRTTITSAGKSFMTVEQTGTLPPKVVQSLRDNIPSMTPQMVFDHYA